MIEKTVKFKDFQKRVGICEDFEEFDSLLDFQIQHFLPDISNIHSLVLKAKNNICEDYGFEEHPVSHFIDYLDDDFAFSIQITQSDKVGFDEKCVFDNPQRLYIEDEDTVFVVNVRSE